MLRSNRTVRAPHFLFMALAGLAGCGGGDPPRTDAGVDATTPPVDGATPDAPGSDGGGVDAQMPGMGCRIGTGCDVLEQTCMMGQGCYYTNAMGDMTACAATEGRVEGAACEFVNECGAGLACANGTCARYCCAATDCEGGETCERLTADGSNPLGYCRAPDMCDPPAGTGCPDGQACYYDLMLRDGTTHCEAAGTRTEGQSCGGMDGLCGPGLGCLSTDMGMTATCLRWCRTDAMPTTCGMGTRCQAIGAMVPYGVCTPMM